MAEMSAAPATAVVVDRHRAGERALTELIDAGARNAALAYTSAFAMAFDALEVIELPPGAEQRIVRLCKRVYRILSMSGYGRMDLRLAEDGRVYVLEANPNPNLSFGEDLAESAAKVGISFEALLQRILNLGLRYQAEWKA